MGKEWGTYWHILQTYAAAEVVFERYMRFIHPFRADIVRYKNESERRVELIGKRKIFFKSGQNFEDLRTESLDGVVIDEARQQRKELWTMVVYPMLSKSKGWADILTSPNGYDWIFDLKKLVENDVNWSCVHAPSTEAWWWTKEEIAIARKNMDEGKPAQEIMAEIRNLRAGRVYYAFGDHNKTLECPFAVGRQWSPYVPVIVGCDFNVHPMAWTMGQLNAKRWWWFDEVRLLDSNTPEAAKELRDKIIIMKDSGFRADPNLIICGDASGNSRSTKASAGESDYDILKTVLKEAGITFRDDTPAQNPSIKDRVNAMNASFRNAAGDISSWIHPENCKWLVHDLDRVIWKDGSNFILDPGKDRMLTHSSDGAGYPVAEFTPVASIGGIGKTRIIQRTL